MAFWSIPQLWSTSTCYVLGGGPSLANLNLKALEAQNTRIIAVNNAYRVAPWADFCYFMDKTWFKWHRKELKNFMGVLVSGDEKTSSIDFVHTLQRGVKHHHDPRRTHMGRGNNSGHGAISLGASLGAKKIILLGFDMRVVDGKHNFHDDHKRKVAATIYERSYLKSFDFLAKDLLELGVQVQNATPGSALKAFPIVEVPKCLQ